MYSIIPSPYMWTWCLRDLDWRDGKVLFSKVTELTISILLLFAISYVKECSISSLNERFIYVMSNMYAICCYFYLTVSNNRPSAVDVYLSVP